MEHFFPNFVNYFLSPEEKKWRKKEKKILNIRHFTEPTHIFYTYRPKEQQQNKQKKKKKKYRLSDNRKYKENTRKLISKSTILSTHLRKMFILVDVNWKKKKNYGKYQNKEKKTLQFSLLSDRQNKENYTHTKKKRNSRPK